jgi:PAS domain S-box-containing protein
MHRIMVVDDEVIITAQLERRLVLMGYEVVGRANSGEKSVDMARRLRPDLVLMDIVMPGKYDGIEAARLIKEDMDIPVIFMTAYADEEYVKRAKNVEPFGYIVKPFQEKEVRATIEVALHKKGIERTMTRSMERLRKTVDSLQEAVVTLDNSGRITFWNRKARELFGFPETEEMGIKIGPLVFCPGESCFDDRVARTISGKKKPPESGETWIEGCRVIRGDGTEIPVEIKLVGHQSKTEPFATCILREPTGEDKGLGGLPANRIIPICSYCRMVRDEQGKWHTFEEYLQEKAGVRFSHGICPGCMETLHPEAEDK